MADYSISKDPTATNLTNSKNSTNRVTVSKNPGSTKAYFTKSGGFEVAVVKSSGLGPELSPDVEFINGLGAAANQWNDQASGSAIVSEQLVLSAANEYADASIPEMIVGTTCRFYFNVVSNTGILQFYHNASQLVGSDVTTTGIITLDLIIIDAGTDVITVWQNSGASTIEFLSIKQVL